MQGGHAWRKGRESRREKEVESERERERKGKGEEVGAGRVAQRMAIVGGWTEGVGGEGWRVSRYSIG